MGKQEPMRVEPERERAGASGAGGHQAGGSVAAHRRWKPAGRRMSAIAATGFAAAVALSACSSSSSASLQASAGAKGSSGGGAPSGSTLVVAAFNPFSGSKAAYGPLMMSGCVPAVNLINADGGVLGHKMSCTPSDSRGDPADAVPTAEKLVSTTSNLVAVLGPSSLTAPATVPIFNSAKVPMFLDAGQAEFDKSAFSYLWRFIPPDAADGYAMAMWGHDKGYTRAASIFSSSSSTTGAVQGVKVGFPKLGGSLVFSDTITSDQPSYQTVIENMLAKKPQVIFYDAGASTSATFLGELKQLGGGSIPIIGPEVITEPSWQSAVSGAIGAAAVKSDISVVEASVNTSTPGWSTFDKALLAAGSAVPKASTYASDPFTIGNYDAVNLVALAILEKHSTNRTTINNAIASLLTSKPGAVVVHSFAEGKTALASGKTIQYEGAGGPLVLNKYHNTSGNYTVVSDSPSHTTLGSVSASSLNKLLG